MELKYQRSRNYKGRKYDPFINNKNISTITLKCIITIFILYQTIFFSTSLQLTHKYQYKARMLTQDTNNLKNQNQIKQNNKQISKQNSDSHYIVSQNKKKYQSSLPDLDSGAYYIQNDGLGQRFHCFNITLGFKPPALGYEVAISLRNIQNYYPSNGLDFAIRYSKQQTLVKGVFQIDKTAKWTKVHFWYVMTSRIDLRAGSFVADTSQLLPCITQTKQIQVIYHLQNPWRGIKSKDYVVLVAFLSGIKTQDSKLGVYITSQKFDIELSTITLQILTTNLNSPLESLYLCYFILQLGFQYQLENLLDTQITPQQTEGQNAFIGIRGVSTEQFGSGLLQSKLGLNQRSVRGNSSGLLGNSKIGGQEALPSQIKQFRNMFDVKGMVIKNQFLFPIMSPKDNLRDFSTTGNKSSSVQNQQQNNKRVIIEYVTDGQCKLRGGVITTQFNKDGIFVYECKICGNNSAYNYQSNTCQCANTFAKDQNGLCNIKICPNGFFLNNGLCFPQPPQINRTNLNTSINCSEDKQLINGKCVCRQQFYQINDNCIQKPKCEELHGLIYNQFTSQCVCKDKSFFYDPFQKQCNRCPPFKQWNQKQKQCTCQEGAYKIYKSQDCVKCDLHGYFNGKQCFCFPGYIGNGFTCKKLKSKTILLSQSGVNLKME